MFKISFIFLLFLPFLSFGQFNFSEDTLFACYEGQILEVSTLPEGLEDVDLVNNNFDTVLSVQDDIHTPVIPIGFDFVFYGNTYSAVTISTNGYVSFDLSNAGTFSTWAINSDIPNAANSDAVNSIMSPYTDSDPVGTGNMIYGTAGVAPNRIFIVLWNDFEMYNCPANCYSTSLVLVEGSNHIINSIASFNSDCGWNNGAGVQGLYKDASTAFIVNDPATGFPRNYSNNWFAQNETVEYTPVDNDTYTYEFRPGYANFFQPLWYNSAGTLLGDEYVLDYIVPNLNDLPETVTVETVICGDTLFGEIVIETGCIKLEVDNLKMESCVNFADGEFVIGGSGPCPISDYQFSLLNSSGTVVQSQFSTTLPVTFSNLTNDIYRVVYTSAISGCNDTLEVDLPIEFEKPQSHVNITHPLCAEEGSGVVDFSPHGGFNADWELEVYRKNGTLLANYSFDDVPFSVSGLMEGEYNFIVNSPTTCKDTIVVNLVDPPKFEFSKEEFEHNICDAITSFIDFEVQGGVPPYSYSINGKTTLDLIKDPIPIDNYKLEAIDNNGCILTRDVEIQDRFSPKVDFIMPKEVNLADATVQFQDLTVPNEYTKLQYWLWEFGDTEVSYEQNPTHTFKAIGTYKVFLFATDETGCQGFLEKEINVVSPTFILPTAFTPNGDGNNEIFKPIIGRITNEDFHMQISDRWGRKIFTTNNIHEGWDGRDKNGNIQEGSYVWIASYKDEFGYEKQENGIVQLIK